ncbi:MAG TPA: ABC transporter permease [Acidimicrobiia bacterium]|nr:ABC transporter permease [Acidimicrobiia bacterium]
MRALHIGIINVKRMLRERSNIFFVFIFPLAIVLLVGIQFGGSFAPVIGISVGGEGELTSAIVGALEEDDSVDLRRFESSDEVVTAVERGGVQAGVLLPADMDTTVASGDSVGIGYVSRPDGAGAQLQSLVAAAIAEVMRPVGAAQFAVVETGEDFDETLQVAEGIAEDTEPIVVEVSAVGEALFPATLGRFDLGASSQLVLFVFLTALAGSSALILTRQLGISQRMLSTPTSMRAIIVGESLGRFGTALVQGVYIMVLTLVMFQVNWGDPVGATLILVALSAVGAGAGMLMGSVFSNDQQAAGIGVMLALGLAALGGAMFPAELFSPTMQRVAHVTPHAWALDGFAELVRRDGNTLDILPELGVLAVYAIGLLGLASWRLRVAITRP